MSVSICMVINMTVRISMVINMSVRICMELKISLIGSDIHLDKLVRPENKFKVKFKGGNDSNYLLNK